LEDENFLVPEPAISAMPGLGSLALPDRKKQKHHEVIRKAAE